MISSKTSMFPSLFPEYTFTEGTIFDFSIWDGQKNESYIGIDFISLQDLEISPPNTTLHNQLCAKKQYTNHYFLFVLLIAEKKPEFLTLMSKFKAVRDILVIPYESDSMLKTILKVIIEKAGI
jgi:hypothetical protein